MKEFVSRSEMRRLESAPQVKALINHKLEEFVKDLKETVKFTLNGEYIIFERHVDELLKEYESK